MKNLIASKSMTYATRRLAAGDLFTATPRDARLLLALKRAKLVDDPSGDEAKEREAKPVSKPKAARKPAVKRQPKAR